MYTVYEIRYEGERIYIGYTGRTLDKREYEHNYQLRKGNKRTVYHFLRSKDCDTVKLTKLKTFKKKIEAKRYECYLILRDYFNKCQLLNKVPNISDR